MGQPRIPRKSASLSAKAVIIAHDRFALRTRLEYFDHDSVRSAEHEIAASAAKFPDRIGNAPCETQRAYSEPAFAAVFFAVGFFGAC